MNWREDALCVQTDPDLWFADKGDSGAYAHAKAICERCPVRQECLDEHMAAQVTGYGDYGVWGGTTPKEREQLRRDQKEAAA